jgi:N-acetylmuramoyl-L-alanine amidase
MDKAQSLKRRLLREAVRDNVDVIKGRYRFKKPDNASRLQTVVRVLVFIAAPLALLFSSYLIATVAGDWLEVRAAGKRGPLEDPALASGMPTGGASASAVGVSTDALALLSDEQLAALNSAPPIDPAAFPLDVRRVVIDPGHGGENLGTEAPSGLIEKEVALDISLRLGRLLDAASFEPILTRQDDEFLSLENRVVFANSSRGDLFVSIHLNWIDTREVRGVETYFLGPTNDPYLTRLAAQENKESGYSMADYRSMLDRVYADVRQTESRRLASTIQQSLYNSLRRVNPELQDRGVKKAPFVVLVGTEMPAILAEVSCLSNAQEARLLMTPEYRQYIAEALFEGIDSYAEQVRGAEHTGS